MRVVRTGKYRIYIRANDHSLPHCHVKYNDGSQICVELPTVTPMYGATIERDLEELIISNLDNLTDAWDLLHPTIQYKQKK